MTRPPNPELAERILDRAEALVAEGGLAALNMRGLAKSLGITATTIYGYFDSKDDLIQRLKLRASGRLNERIRSIPPSLSPHETLHELGRRYLAFAEEHPRLYKLLFEELEGGPPGADDVPVMYRTYYTARNALERMAAGGEMPFEPMYGALMGWVMLHGFCSLLISGRLELAEDLDREELRHIFLTFYTGGGRARPGDPDHDG
ncbi:MAG: TetR family transcriptional regulator [Candidatus Coatesbacteria bacterium]|nr:TetR family transcriptional regulator [Candidatus Coatesbacteria bacterium]